MKKTLTNAGLLALTLLAATGCGKKEDEPPKAAAGDWRVVYAGAVDANVKAHDERFLAKTPPRLNQE